MSWRVESNRQITAQRFVDALSELVRQANGCFITRVRMETSARQKRIARRLFNAVYQVSQQEKPQPCIWWVSSMVVDIKICRKRGWAVIGLP